jgi:Uma2 family endonuclease
MKSLAKWSVEDYHRMREAGILNGRSVELLAGEIVEMSPKTPLHYTTAKRGARHLGTLLAGQAEVRFNGLITLSDSEPEPDIAIVRPPDSAYLDRHPAPQDIFWIVEVAKFSLKTDLELKASIDAAADIQEYWVLDLAAQQLVVVQRPQASQYSKM